MKILGGLLPQRTKYLNIFCFEKKLNFIKWSVFFQNKNSKSSINATSNPLAVKLLTVGHLLGTYTIFLNSVLSRCFINRVWRDFLTVDILSKLITEETVHYLNIKINYLSDTRVFEWEIHTNLLWSILSDVHRIDRLPLGNDKVNLIFEQKY